jgi:hypothetical protein
MEVSRSLWYQLCKDYDDNHKKVKQKVYLATQKICDQIKDTPSNLNSFSRCLKKYRAKELEDSDAKRVRERKFQVIEDRLIAYVDLRARLYAKDKCGTNWMILEQKCKLWASQEGLVDFKASAGWISGALRRNSKIGITLHGEANDLPEEERVQLMGAWRTEFHAILDRENIPPERVYNGDQSGLYYNKLPNRIYVTKAERSSYAGVKQMKSKDRVTIMVCIAADGSKIPLSIIGKSKTPECFRHELDNPSEPPMAYKDQSNAWFDREITIWWINHVFWPWHVRKFGNVKAILLLDNCLAHTNLEKSRLPEKLMIHFFPPNVTSRHQPADMGIIAAIKVGYRTHMLVQLLALFDEPDGFENAERARKRRRRGCKGLDVGGKATILDTMILLLKVWNDDSKYASPEAIKRCWRKADILPAS